MLQCMLEERGKDNDADIVNKFTQQGQGGATNDT